MGNWHISIKGIGVHNNPDCPQDAERMARRFVRELKEAGHSIVDADVTAGGATKVGGGELGYEPRTSGDGREDK